jgi:hypothetical protein
VPDRAYTDADLDVAIAAVADPQRLREAQDLVVRAAPALQRRRRPDDQVLRFAQPARVGEPVDGGIDVGV